MNVYDEVIKDLEGRIAWLEIEVHGYRVILAQLEKLLRELK